MIFVTVGTHTQPFNRLLEKIDELIEKGIIKEKVIAQVGYSTYKPRNYEYFTFTSEEKILELYKKARLIIAHAGVGSIIITLQFRKPIIVVPRLKKFGEHINDHQAQIARVFEREGKILVCYNVGELGNVIQKAKSFKPNLRKRSAPIFKLVSKFLRKMEGN